MSMNDLLSDMIARVNNGQQANLYSVRCPASKLSEAVLGVLKEEGYIANCTRENIAPGRDELVVELKYHEGEPVIKKMVRVSTPGRRVYTQISDLQQVQNGLGVSVLSTSKGVMSDYEARRQNVGGELLCEAF